MILVEGIVTVSLTNLYYKLFTCMQLNLVLVSVDDFFFKNISHIILFIVIISYNILLLFLY